MVEVVLLTSCESQPTYADTIRLMEAVTSVVFAGQFSFSEGKQMPHTACLMGMP